MIFAGSLALAAVLQSKVQAREGLSLQVAKVKEQKFLRFDRKKFKSDTLAFSGDSARFAVITRDNKVIVDNKTYGPFFEVNRFIFSGDSKHFAFLASTKIKEPLKMYLDGVEQKNPNQIVRIQTAGVSGPICWFEAGEKGVRLVKDGVEGDWGPKIERFRFSDDGLGYYIARMLRDPKPVDPKDAQGGEDAPPDAQITYSMNGGTPAVRSGIRNIYPAPLGINFLTEFSDSKSNAVLVNFRGQDWTLPGQMSPGAVFSANGLHAAVKSFYTAPSPRGNVEKTHYVVDGETITELDTQYGFTFYPEGNQWIMCGLRDGIPHLLQPLRKPIPVNEFPGLESAPNEIYRAVVFSRNRPILLFQSRKSRPSLFCEGMGLVPLPVSAVAPGSLSVSPDGRYLVFATDAAGSGLVYALDLDRPSGLIEIGKGDYQILDPNSNRPVWLGPKEFRLIALRGTDFLKLEVKLPD